MTGDWNPIEYYKRARDPGAARQAMKAIEQDTALAMLEIGLTKDEQQAVRLEGHLRQVLASFTLAGIVPPTAQGNACVTALVGALGRCLADAVKSEGDIVRILATIEGRIAGIMEHELRNRQAEERARVYDQRKTSE